MSNNCIIIFRKEDESRVTEEILPLFNTNHPNLVSFEDIDENSLEDGSKYVLFLNEKDISIFVPLAAEHNIRIGILPHPDVGSVSKALAISDDLETCVKDILNPENEHSVDLFLCNNIPIFQSMIIGSVFTVDQDRRDNFILQASGIIKKLWRLRTVKHWPFEIIVGDEKQYETSALGIISVEYSQASILTRKLIQDTSTNDGKFHTLILSPENVFQVLKYLLNNMAFWKSKNQSLPGFISYIKCEGMVIKNNNNAEISIDGNIYKFDQLEIKIIPEALHLLQASVIDKKPESEGSSDSFRTQHMPQGEKRKELINHVMPWLPKATTEDFKELFQVLRQNAQNSNAYLVMMGLSTVIATFGLFANSTPVIIGAMILAPLMGPLVSFSMGMIRYDVNMLKDSTKTIIIGTILSILLAALVSSIIPIRLITSEMSDRMTPNLLDLGIAVASGIAAAYAHAKEEIAKTLAGVAIAVALIPPLAVAGVGIGWMDWAIFSGAVLLYMTNLVGIILFGGLSFIFLGYSPFSRARKALLQSFFILVILAIPLGFSYFGIVKEAKVTRALEGKQINSSILRNVKVRRESPLVVSLSLLSDHLLTENEIKKIKMNIDSILDEKVTLEVDQGMRITIE